MTKYIEPDKVDSINAINGQQHGQAYFEQLRRKLRWQLLLAYVTPLLILSSYFHIEYNATLREGINNHLRSVAENQRNTVDLFLQERVANVRSAFRHEELTFPPNIELMDKMLEELRRESTTFVDLGLFRADGLLIAYAGPFPSLVGKDYSGEAWFKQLASEKRDFFISDVYLGFRGKPHFIVAVRRIVSAQQWILRASVDPEKFGEFVGSSYLFEDAEAFIINSEGRRQTFSDTASQEHHAVDVPPRTPGTLLAEANIGRRKYLSAIAWLAENDWALVVQVPRDMAYASLSKTRFVLVGIILTAICFIVAVVLRSTKKLVDKLEAADKAKESLRLQLFNAAKLASVGEMAAGVAHEINNPLAIIYEEAAMMLDIFDPEFGYEMDMWDFRDRLGAIKEATMRGRIITNKLLAFARRHDPNPKPSDLNLLIDRVLAVKEVDFRVSNIEVIRDYAEDLPWVMVNRNQMDQVILNLLNNAKDAIDEAGKIIVRTKQENSWARIDIEDTGRGMPPDVIEKVFFPFFTTKGVGKGTGLGLSISYGIVESHGGRIEVKSRVGTGTTFTIFLPVEEVSEKKAKAKVARGGNVQTSR